MSDLLSKFVVFLPQVADLPREPIDLRLRILFFLAHLLLHLYQLLPERLDFISFPLVGLVLQGDILLPLLRDSILLPDLLHLLFLHLLELLLLLLLEHLKLPLLHFELLLVILQGQLLGIDLAQFLVIVLHGLV